MTDIGKVRNNQISLFTHCLLVSSEKKDVHHLNEFCARMEDQDIFFNYCNDKEVSECLILFSLETLLNMLRVTDVEDALLCDAAYKLISLLVDISITHDCKLVDPCARYLLLFVELSSAMLTLNEHSDLFHFPLEFVHFQYDFSKCSDLLALARYTPLLVNSNAEIHCLFVHSIRIVCAHHRVIRHLKHNSPVLYNMVSVSQLWNCFGHKSLRMSLELISLGTAVCLAEFSPAIPAVNTTLLQELVSLLSMLTGEEIHTHYLKQSQAPVFSLFVDRVCQALEVFKIAINELSKEEHRFFETLSARLLVSFFSPHLPPAVASVMSLLLHDCILICPNVSLSALSLMDSCPRHVSPSNSIQVSVVLSSSLYAYTHLRASSLGYPHSALKLVAQIATAHLERVRECSRRQDSSQWDSLGELAPDLSVLDMLLETCLRLATGCFRPRFCSIEELSAYKCDDLVRSDEAGDFCSKILVVFEEFSELLCAHARTLPTTARALLLQTSQCYASIVCLCSSELLRSAGDSSVDPDHVMRLLFDCVDTLTNTKEIELGPEHRIGVARVIQVLAAGEKKPSELCIIYKKLMGQPISPQLMLSLTSSLPLALKSLPNNLADSVADTFSGLLNNCVLSAEEWTDFSLELAARLPIIVSLLSYPSLCHLEELSLPSHHPLPLFSSFYALRLPDQQNLGRFLQQGKDFLDTVQSLLLARKLALPVQLAVVTSLFDLSFVIPVDYPFIPTVLTHILLSSSFALAFLLVAPLNSLLQRIVAFAKQFKGKQWSVLEHPALRNLLGSLKQILYETTVGANPKLLVIECYNNLVCGLDKLGRLDEAIRVFKIMLQCSFIKDFRNVVCCKIWKILKGRGDSEGGVDHTLRSSAFAAIPEFLAQDLFKQEQNHEKLADYLNGLKLAFEMDSIKNLLEHMLARLVQLILKIKLSDEKKLEILKFIAKYTETSVSAILQANLSNIYSDMVFNSLEGQLEIKIGFLKTHCEDLSGTLKIVERDLIDKLALSYSKNPSAVREGMAYLYSLAYPNKSMDQQSQIELVIRKQFLGMLKALEDLNKNSSSEQQLVFVNSLNCLIGMLGPACINSAPHKLMASLTYFLYHHDEKITKASFVAWETFTSCLDLPPSDPIWIHIIVTLYNFMCSEKLGHHLTSLFTELIFRNAEGLHVSASYVYTASLPADPLFDGVKDKLVPVVIEVSKISLVQRLEHIKKGLAHEALIVRKFVLEALLPLIEANKHEISQLIGSSPFVHQVISNLIQTLTRSFELKQDANNLQLTRCIGALGAVDPARLQIERKRQVSSTLPICKDITNDTDCAVRILTELATSLATSTAQSDDQDLVSLAIQRVLSAYKMSEPNCEMRNNIERGIDKHMWSVIQPYLYSRYILEQSRCTQGELDPKDPSASSMHPIPIYKSEMSKTYNHWLSRFYKRLSSYIIHPAAQILFQACSNLIAQINPKIGFMLLPNMIIHIMLDSSFCKESRVAILCVVLSEFEYVIDVAYSEFKQSSLKPGDATHLKLIVETILSVYESLTQLKNNHRLRKTLNREQLKELSDFLSKFHLHQLVDLAEYCNQFPLALRYLEQHIRQDTLDLRDHPETRKKLGWLYQLLEDRDSVLGLKKFRRELPSLEESILEQLYENNISGVLSLYKNGILQQPHNSSLKLDLIQTQLDFGYASDAELQLEHAMRERSESNDEFLPFRLEACWKLSHWDKLDQLVRQPDGELLDMDTASYSSGNAHWRLGLGILLYCAYRREEKEFFKQLEGMRKQRSSFLSSHSLKCVSNDQCYLELVRLCMLRELEEGVKTFVFCSEEQLTDQQRDLITRWNKSLLWTRKSYKIREPIISLRKAILSISPLCESEKPADFDLEIAKLSRECDIREPGEAALIRMDHFEPTSPLWLLSNLEKAKFISKFGSGDVSKSFSIAAVQHVEKILSIADRVTAVEAQDRWDRLLLKCKLHKFRQALNQPHYDYHIILGEVERFVESLEESSCLDKALYTLAEFQFKLATDVYKEFAPSARGEKVDRKCERDNHSKFASTQGAILNYFKLVKQNNKYTITAMPKAISLWLTTMKKLISFRDDQLISFSVELNLKVAEAIKILQPNHLYAAFSILLSHISGTNQETFNVQARMIKLVYCNYPTICIWFMIGLTNSSNSICKERIEGILKNPYTVTMSPDAKNKLAKVYKLTRILTQTLASFPSKEESRELNNFRLSFWNPKLLTLGSDAKLSSLVLPTEYCLQFPINFPNFSCDKLPTILKFENYCRCYLTMRNPKRFRVQASDGNLYDFLYKQIDDLRKDQRLMEIFIRMNLLMKKDPHCSERIPLIRTYAAIHLGENCGLLEWVNHRIHMKEILFELYRHADQPITDTDIIREIGSKKHKAMEMVRQSNMNLLARCSPPVFHKWFFNSFPVPTDWYLARQEYTRSTAVMSMAGYVIGLGDRHPENMLISMETGHLMHVDFGCLLREGEWLTVPEVVPYRLTHNVIDGMGVLNYEGCFRWTCEATLRCFRNEYQTLFPILRNMNSAENESQVGDPKPKSSNASPSETETERKIREAAVRINGVHLRLKGYGEDQRTLLSVEGQVDYTIIEATKKSNLMSMFGGWSSFF